MGFARPGPCKILRRVKRGAARARVGFACRRVQVSDFGHVIGAARARVGFARPQHPGKFSRKCSSRRSKCPAKPLLRSWASWCALKAIFCRHINPLPHALSPFLGHSRASFFWPKASKTHFLRCSGFLSAKYSAIICSTASLSVLFNKASASLIAAMSAVLSLSTTSPIIASSLPPLISTSIAWIGFRAL